MQTARTLAAATIIARDFDYMLDEHNAPICRAALSESKAAAIIYPGARLLPNRQPAHVEMRLVDLSADALRRLRDGVKNRRLLSAITIALEMPCQVSIDLEHDAVHGLKGSITLIMDLYDERIPASALPAIATWLTVTHSEMVRVVKERCGHEVGVPDFAFTPPQDAADCIARIRPRIEELTSWVKEQLRLGAVDTAARKTAAIRGATPLSRNMPTLERIGALLGEITLSDLSTGNHERVTQAQALLATLTKGVEA